MFEAVRIRSRLAILAPCSVNTSAPDVYGRRRPSEDLRVAYKQHAFGITNDCYGRMTYLFPKNGEHL